MAVNQHRLESVGIKAVSISGYAYHAQAMIQEDATDQVVGQFFYEYRVSGLGEDRGSQVDTLGSPGRQEKRGRVHR